LSNHEVMNTVEPSGAASPSLRRIIARSENIVRDSVAHSDRLSLTV
jgi:hypothetical protein